MGLGQMNELQGTYQPPLLNSQQKVLLQAPKKHYDFPWKLLRGFLCRTREVHSAHQGAVAKRDVPARSFGMLRLVTVSAHFILSPSTGSWPGTGSMKRDHTGRSGPAQHQRCCIIQPSGCRAARLPWVTSRRKSTNPEGVAASGLARPSVFGVVQPFQGCENLADDFPG